MAIQRKWFLKPSCRARAYSNQIRTSCGSCGTIWLLPLPSLQLSLLRILDVLSPYAISSLPTRPTRSSQTTDKALWAVLLRTTPNLVSRISHLHCAFQKTRADPDLGMNPIQTNPAFNFINLPAVHVHVHHSTEHIRRFFSATSVGRRPLLLLQYIQHAPSSFLDCIVP
jgi:hypothetical protein